MDDQAFLATCGGVYDQQTTERRRLQNRIAQRKFREKLRTNRRRSTREEYDDALVWSDDTKNANPNKSPFHALNDIQQDWNILGSRNEDHGQLPFIDESRNEPGQAFVKSSRQESQEIQYHNDQSTAFNLARKEIIMGTDSQNVKSRNISNQPYQESVQGLNGYLGVGKNVKLESISLVQSQRERICDQAEKHLEKALSLYDFGVSLDIVVADPCLRDLLVHASQRFRDRRLCDISDEFN